MTAKCEGQTFLLPFKKEWGGGFLRTVCLIHNTKLIPYLRGHREKRRNLVPNKTIKKLFFILRIPQFACFAGLKN